MKRLNEDQVFALTLLAVVLPSVISWAQSGLPTDRASVGFLLSSALSALLVFILKLIKEETVPAKEMEEKIAQVRELGS